MKTALAILCFICAVPMALSMLMAANYMIPYEGDPIDTPEEYLEMCYHYDTIPQPDQLKLIRDIPVEYHAEMQAYKCQLQERVDSLREVQVTNQKSTEDD